MNYTQKSKIKQDSATKNIVSDAWIGIIMLPSRLVGVNAGNVMTANAGEK